MRLVDADKLDDLIVDLNEKGWEITRGEYKRIDRVVFEMSTVDVFDKIRAEIKSLSNANPSYWNICDVVEREEVLEIIDKYRGEQP